MKDDRRLEWLIECLIHIIGRAAVKVEEVHQIVETGRKQIKAFNLCDGQLTLSEVAEKTGLDKGNLSRAFDRWVKNGVAFQFCEGKEVRLLHIYPIPEQNGKGKNRKRRKQK